MSNYIACSIKSERYILYAYSFLKLEDIIEASAISADTVQFIITFKSASINKDALESICVDFRLVNDTGVYSHVHNSLSSFLKYRPVSLNDMYSSQQPETWFVFKNGISYLRRSGNHLVKVEDLTVNYVLGDLLYDDYYYPIASGFLDEFIIRNINQMEVWNMFKSYDLCRSRYNEIKV